MISIKLQTKGNLRLRELSKYLSDERNFGVSKHAINTAIKTESKKAFGKPAMVGNPQNKTTNMPGEALLQSINKVKRSDTPLKINEVSNNQLMAAIKADSELFNRYKKANQQFGLGYASDIGSRAYAAPVIYSNSFLDLKLNKNSLNTSVRTSKVNTFLSSLSTSAILANDMLKEAKKPKAKKISFFVDSSVSEMPISDPVSKEKFLSGAQLSILVRKHLYRTSPVWPAKNPPNLSIRTGQNFIETVEINPNYRQNMISYMYNPLMDVHNNYDPSGQIERSIRTILREYYKRELRPETRFLLKKG